MAASSASHSSLNMRPTGVSSKKRSGWSVVSRPMSPPCSLRLRVGRPPLHEGAGGLGDVAGREAVLLQQIVVRGRLAVDAVSYTHLRAHETRHDLVCRLLLE